MKSNFDKKTVESFGEEWKKYDQRTLNESEAKIIFDKYFSIFPWESLPVKSEGFDMGCGTGRWSKFVAPKVSHLTCIDPSDAIEVAKNTLTEFSNISFLKESVDQLSLEPESQDFGFSLGVLHHVPDTEAGIKDCCRVLKKGAPFLMYLYYEIENRFWLIKTIWKLSNVLRFFISKLPNKIKNIITDFLALTIYYPLSRTAYYSEKLGLKVNRFPLSFYKDCSFYTMRTDSRDRFGTPLEKRFTKEQIKKMMINSDFQNIKFSNEAPYWCVVGTKK